MSSTLKMSAFPVLPPVNAEGYVSSGFPYPESGMTLRDWFAGMALMSLNAEEWHDPKKLADYSYILADAMLTARGD